jgi:hypothetical protein
MRHAEEDAPHWAERYQHQGIESSVPTARPPQMLAGTNLLVLIRPDADFFNTNG